MQREKLKHDNEKDGTHLVEFRRRYFKYARYAGVITLPTQTS